VADRVGATVAMIAAPAKRAHPTGRTCLWSAIAEHLGDDPPGAPAERLERAELARPPATAPSLQLAGRRREQHQHRTHLPRSFVSLAAAGQRPVTSLAKLLEAVTVSPGSSREISPARRGCRRRWPRPHRSGDLVFHAPAEVTW